MRWLSALPIAALVLAGCSGGTDPTDVPDGEHIQGDSVVRGLVTDDELRPLGGALVAVTTADQRIFESATGADGKFSVSDVPAGRHNVQASRDGFEVSKQPIILLPGQSKDIRFVLVPLPGGGIFNETVTFRGKYDCAAETPTGTGSCDSTLVGAGGQPVFDEDANHTFVVPNGWGGLLFEVNWSTSSDTDTIRGVRLKVGSEVDNTTYIRALDTDRPLRLALNTTEVHINGHPDRPLPSSGDRVWITVQPVGQGANPCSPQDPCTGVGGSAEMRYTLWLTTFTGSKVDWTFTGMPASE